MPASPEIPHYTPPHRNWIIALLVIVSALLGACSVSHAPLAPLFRSAGEPTLTPFQPISWTPTPSSQPATPTPTQPPYSLWLDPQLPQDFQARLSLPPEYGLIAPPQRATLQLTIGETHPVSQWVYALAAPFPTLVDGFSAREVRQAWAGKPDGDLKRATLLVDESTLWVFSALWGKPGEGAVEVLPTDQLLKAAWDHPPSYAILPFEQLEPRWKVIQVNGVSPVHKDFDLEGYALTVPISLVGEAPLLPAFPPSNLDPGKLTTLVMTGVTALVRATAFTMEQKGITYPAKDIVDWLREADITHISNEVPFAEDCPFPNPVQEGMKFCSDSRYIELLEYIGADIIELTGDHFSDWGSEAMLFTLELYDERVWPYYGGGENLKSGRQPVILSHNGNRLAFIGCNAKGSGYAHASADNPGAVTCDFETMQSQIESLRAEGVLPIATFQHFEYYTYTAQPNQVRDAQALAKAGAVIVSGSQAHQPQAFEFSHGAFIHHGLGNLFFDQLDVSSATRQGFIDRHVFYAGRHISTELLTFWFVDYARSRPMTPAERQDLLNQVFQASGY